MSRKSAPGRLDARTRKPYAAEMATPPSAVSPTKLQSPAAVASRTPHPAIDAGMTMLISTGATSGARIKVGVSTPTARAAPR